MYPVGTNESTRTVTTILALSKLWKTVLMPHDRTRPSSESYPGEVNVVMGLEAPLERFLEPEREHD